MRFVTVEWASERRKKESTAATVANVTTAAITNPIGICNFEYRRFEYTFIYFNKNPNWNRWKARVHHTASQSAHIHGHRGLWRICELDLQFSYVMAIKNVASMVVVVVLLLLLLLSLPNRRRILTYFDNISTASLIWIQSHSLFCSFNFFFISFAVVLFAFFDRCNNTIRMLLLSTVLRRAMCGGVLSANAIFIFGCVQVLK